MLSSRGVRFLFNFYSSANIQYISYVYCSSSIDRSIYLSPIFPMKMDEDEVRSSLEGKGLEVRQPVHLGESASLNDPNNLQVTAQQSAM